MKSLRKMKKNNIICIIQARMSSSRLPGKSLLKINGEPCIEMVINRVKKSKYFPTLVAIVQTPIYAKERRHITPRECARLQSFPDSFQLHENDQVAYKQFGNAVNVDVVHYVMSRTLKSYNAFA